MSAIPASAIVRELVAAGVTGDALVTALERMEAAGEHRSAGAIRQARYRKNEKAKEEAAGRNGDVTRNESASSLSYLLPSSTEIAKKEEGVRGRAKRSRGQPLPADFAPNDGHYAVAMQLRGRREFADECLTEMREWAMANGNRAITRKADWSMTLLGWMRRSNARAGPRTVGGFAPRPGSREDNRERTHHALAKLRSYVETHADDEGGGGGAGRSDAGLLPFVGSSRS